jgi:hypothetical protein
MELPLDGRQENFSQGGASRSITFAAGKPVIVRARFARAPKAAAPDMTLTLAIEAQGADGILSVKTEGGGIGEKALVTAGVPITALIADKNIGDPGPGGDASGVFLHILLTAAAGLSTFLKDQGGKVVLHGLELTSEGQKMPVGGLLRLKLDYSVDVVIDTFDVGVLSIGMRPNQPMKVRVRAVTLTVDPAKSGLEMIHLGVDEATMEIEDPGGWNVKSPGSLFDILGTRSGHGSTWIEIDLRFKLDLGPIKVSGATIRATIADDGGIDASLRGLEASLNLAPAIEGTGAFQLLPPAAEGRPPSFSAMLAARIIPLNLSAEATLLLEGEMIKLSLGVDLPGPIPLASTGLGIFGLGGVFAINGRPKPYEPGIDREADIVTYELAWDYRDARLLQGGPRRLHVRTRSGPRDGARPRLHLQRSGGTVPDGTRDPGAGRPPRQGPLATGPSRASLRQPRETSSRKPICASASPTHSRPRPRARRPIGRRSDAGFSSVSTGSAPTPV